MPRRSVRRGFTLVEILVVICIMTILMALLVVIIRGAIDRARTEKTRAIISTLSAACDSYKQDFGIFPPSNPHKESANLHLYLGRKRRMVEQRSQDGTNDIVVDRDPYIRDFRKDWLIPGAPNNYPDPPSEVIDAWDQPLHYRSPGLKNKRGVDIWSDGRNTKTDEDDLGNWPEE